MDYTTLSLADVKAGLEDAARDAESTFGALDARQLNWRPGPERWSVAQCLEHLITSNRLMLQSAEDAVSGAAPRSLWQRVPGLPGVLGRMLIRSQAPDGTRRFKTTPRATPTASDIGADVIARFVAQHRDAARRAQALDGQVAARTVMTSPFMSVISYSVLDGWRLMVAHDRRHLEQARRVMQEPGFPDNSGSGHEHEFGVRS